MGRTGGSREPARSIGNWSCDLRLPRDFAVNRSILVLAAVATGLSAAPAFAAEKSALGAAFKNTIVSTYPDGRQARLWLKADGSYTAEGRRKDRSDGHWKLKGDQICLRQSHPATLPLSYCTAIPSGGLGASWRAKSVTGEPITVTLVKGRSA